ncbi:GntR family transcriptional regulator [Paenibacillus sp. IB182496]|uniref:GntR family transcriptional regulator n=1 Tax=Paenibacillus sabuli TaxID=2772509 RepID=A0A927BWZ4_9BACL|nr:GntR family transcriptional regulator [Paenibacillus sabuli]MBD2847431.1 GntR family transcriptional regulator [Paenibacillus sabuli]
MLQTTQAAGRRPLSEVAYELVRDRIVYLELLPGQMVYESELSSALGMSRTPLREAVRALQAEGLIEVLPQRGARIARISASKVGETRFVRAALEAAAFRELAAGWRDRPDRLRLEQSARLLLEEQREAARQGDAKQFLKTDEAFHGLFLRAYGNATALGVVGQMRGHLNRIRYLMLQRLDQTDALIAEHEQLLEALIGGEAPRAATVLEHHLHKVLDDLPDMAAAEPEWFEA